MLKQNTQFFKHLATFLPITVSIYLAWLTYHQALVLKAADAGIQASKNVVDQRLAEDKNQLDLLLQKHNADLSLRLSNNEQERDLSLKRLDIAVQRAGLDLNRSLKQEDVALGLALKRSDVSLGQSLKKSDVDVRLVEVAVDILKAEPTEENKALKEWATKVVDNHSDVKLDQRALAELKRSPLPSPDETHEQQLLLPPADRVVMYVDNVRKGNVLSYNIANSSSERNCANVFRFQLDGIEHSLTGIGGRTNPSNQPKLIYENGFTEIPQPEPTGRTWFDGVEVTDSDIWLRLPRDFGYMYDGPKKNGRIPPMYYSFSITYSFRHNNRITRYKFSTGRG